MELIRIRLILNDDLCDKLCEAAKNKAKELNIDISFAICDANGQLLLFRRFGDAPIISTTLVPNKAYTSAVMFLPTEKLKKLCADGGPLMGLETMDSKITFISGGYPLFADNMCIGAIGVGGGRNDEDNIIAEHVLGEFHRLTK